MKSWILGFSILIIICFISCRHEDVRENKAITNNPVILNNTVKKLTDVIVYDIFSPPVASRIYAYTSLAAYEAIRYAEPAYPSLTAQLHGFPAMPKPDAGKHYNYMVAALQAYYDVAVKITYTIDTLKALQQQQYHQLKSAGLSEDVFNNSIKFGDAVAAKILERMNKDHYTETRGYPAFTGADREGQGQWRPTPPDYMSGIEPYWMDIMPMAIDSCNQFRPGPPPAFNTKDTSCAFYKGALEVYEVVKSKTPEYEAIASFWDCNPYTMKHSGHLMFADKKITPGGHWMGIASIASRKTNADMVKTAQTFAATAVALLDGFISSWDSKYYYDLIRPVTVINDHIDQNWEAYLQTPPFPEYTSAHSVISASAAQVLSRLYGEDFHFRDTTELEYGAGERSYTSFTEAAQEAGISRLYGGIHYRNSVMVGLSEGRSVGKYIVSKLKFNG